MIKECLNCNKELTKKYQIKFCSRSCAAIVNNKNKIRKYYKRCKNCNKEINSKYEHCSNKCAQNTKYKERIDSFMKGNLTGYCGKSISLAIWLRRYLKEERGSQCSKCGWDEKHPLDKKSLTEINHIDGDAKNNKLDNLEILCPNCHSMTINFKARNKKSSRNR